MNVRLTHNKIKIRLEKMEVSNFLAAGVIQEVFPVGDSDWLLEIIFSDSLQYVCQGQKSTLMLPAEIREILTQEKFKKEPLVSFLSQIGNRQFTVELEVDLFSGEKRSKRESTS